MKASNSLDQTQPAPAGLKCLVRAPAEPTPSAITEAVFVDAAGRRWVVMDEVAMFWNGAGLPGGVFEGVIPCTVLSERVDDDGRALATVSTKTPRGVEAAITGDTEFEVTRDQLAFTPRSVP